MGKKFSKKELDAAVQAAEAELLRLRVESETDDAKYIRLLAEGMSEHDAGFKIV